MEFWPIDEESKVPNNEANFEDNNGDEDDEEDDDNVCGVCLDGTVYENNEIIFCDKCNVPVHQTCYGVHEVPDGAWYCYVCAAGLDPTSLPCDLCSNKGGAYKPTTHHKWAHAICATWVPEIFSHDGKNRSVLDFTYLDKKRYRLKCALCSTKGACIQCCFGRCATAAHPWCVMFKKEGGFTHRIVKNERGETVWEIFCKQHASAVTEPVRPKPKCKSQPLHASVYNASDNDYDSVESREDKFRGKKSKGHKSDDESSDNEDSDSSDDELSGKVTTNRNNDNSKSRGFQIYNVSEWPGQSEGEGLDLDHFWNVISMNYPEDHSLEWYDFITSPFPKLKPENFLPESILEMPTIGTVEEQRLLPSLTEILWSSFTSEKDKTAVLDYEKRRQLLYLVHQRIEQLRNSVAKLENENCSVEDHFGTEGNAGKVRVAYDVVASFNEETEYFIQSKADEESKGEAVVDSNPVFNVMIDGAQRTACEYQLVLLDGVKNLDEEIVEGTSPYIIGAGEKNEDNVKSVAEKYWLSLIGVSNYPNHSPVTMTDKVLIPKDEDDEICRALTSDQKALSELVSLIGKKLSLLNSAVPERIGILKSKQAEWADIERKYVKQRVWTRIAHCAWRGMRDQGVDFNKQDLEDIPASWSLSVNGRPPAQEDDEEQEDAICMCCFDGSSSDYNRILYCDGCNAALHQDCYGVAEIPEGDFYCERCQALQHFAEQMGNSLEPEEARSFAVCALCPVTHGGLKQTTDNRWVHLCCTLWSKKAVIKDLSEMGPIDIKNVEFQFARENELGGKRYRTWGSGLNNTSNCVFSNIQEPCVFCETYGGYVTRCHHNENGKSCSVVFHPLCAWFKGVFVKTVINDLTCLWDDKDRTFPAGMDFNFFCDQHCPPSNGIRTEQLNIRKKYRLNENSLCSIPGQGKKIRKRKKEGNTSDSNRVSAANREVKVLNPDTYDAHMCAACLSPLEPLFSSLGTKRQEKIKVKCETPAKAIKLESETSLSFVAAGADAASPAVAGTDFLSGVTGTPAVGSNESNCSDYICCTVCKLNFHKKCLKDAHLERFANDGSSDSTWVCFACTGKIHDLQCQLCPRRGGYFCPIVEGKWSHLYCALHAPGIVKINEAGRVDIKMTPKENKKLKCSVCNRRGICEKCSDPNCTVSFHPLCAQRSGKAYIRNRLGVKEAYCLQHVPEGIFRLDSGHWVDGNDIQNLRYTLESTRQILDFISRREKLKRSLNKVEGDNFASKFQRMYDVLVGAKSDSTNSLEMIDERDSDESDSDARTPADVSGAQELTSTKSKRKYNKREAEDWSPIEPQPMTKENEVLISCNSGDFAVGPSWIRDGAVCIPKKVFTSSAGFELDQRETISEGDYRSFVRKMKDRMKKTRESTRESTGIFVSQQAAIDFSDKLAEQISSHLKMSNTAFEKEMTKFKLEYKPPIVPQSPKHDKKAKNIRLNDVEAPSSKKRKPESSDDRNNDSKKLKPVVSCEARHVNKPKIIFNKSTYNHASAAAGNYANSTQLFKSLRENPLVSNIVSNFGSIKGGFATILSLSGMDRVSKNDNYWMNYDSNNQYLLERQLQDIIRGLEGKLIDDDRYLVEEFEEIPDNLLSEYNQYARRLLTMQVINQKLQRHGYASMAMFSKDFYEMLNNARNVTSLQKIWDETSLLAEEFERLKTLSQGKNSIARDVSPHYAVTVVSSSSDSAAKNTFMQKCSICNEQVALENWPVDADKDLQTQSANSQSASNTKSSTRTRKSDKDNKSSNNNNSANKVKDLSIWGWCCMDCLEKKVHPEQLGNQQVRIRVWWHDDQVAYDGTINAYDQIADRHRVLYDDGEWEFLNISDEPVLLDISKLKQLGRNMESRSSRR